MKKVLTKGFTLIELLVVIAIIGILASVVLASLNTARAKGADAAVKSNLDSIRAQAELLYDNNSPNSYSGLCTDAKVAQATAAAANVIGGTVDNTLGNAGSAVKVSCHINAGNDTWAIGSGLKSTTANSWCIDSTGNSKLVTADFLDASAVACP